MIPSENKFFCTIFFALPNLKEFFSRPIKISNWQTGNRSKEMVSFLRIDIGKNEFISHLRSDDKTKSYQNNRKGIKRFVDDHSEALAQGLTVLKTTGGYENRLLHYLFAN